MELLHQLPGPARKALLAVHDALAAAGYECYLVGGAVRDLMMGRPAGDLDLTTNAHPEQARKLFRRTIPTGLQHGTITVLEAGHTFELTTYRSETTYSDARHPDQIHFAETLAEDLAQAAWAEFQQIESECGLVESLFAGHLQARVAETRAALMKDIGRRKTPVTGVSEFPLLEEIAAPVADVLSPPPGDGVDPVGLTTLLPDFQADPGADTIAEPLDWISIAEPFERLRDRSEAHLEQTGARPSVFLATLGPLAEHTARADFARNLFAAGGIEAAALSWSSGGGATKMGAKSAASISREPIWKKTRARIFTTNPAPVETAARI